jgi:hypothetical protein
MSQERVNEAGGWKSKLEELDMVPGEPVFNTGAAWEKLEERIAGKKRTVVPLWYWLVAACLILALMIPFIPAKKTNTNVVLQEKKQPTEKIVTPKPKENNHGIVKLPVIYKRKIKNIKVVAPAVAAIKEEITPEIIQPDTAAVPLVVNVVTPRRKLQVVHINEITEQGNQEELTQHTRSNIRFNEHKGDDFTKAYATNTSDNIIKIKLPSN